jgi:UMF1 family MFS transporter
MYSDYFYSIPSHLINMKEIQPIQKGDPRVIQGWVMYDWANSVYQLTIASTIFPLYYNNVTSAGNNYTVDFFGGKIINSVLYSWAIAASYLLVAAFSPLFSSIADYTGRRKSFMKVFTWIGAAGCGALFFFNKSTIELGVIAFSLGTIGYAGSIVFYNSFLPVIAEPADQDRVSARGYSMGYLGGVLLMLFNLLMIMKPGWFGIAGDSSLPARISFVSVFIWWLGFSQITFLRLPKYTYRKRIHRANVLTNGYNELRMVFRQIRKSPSLTIYLVAYFFFMMGILTVMFMAATFGGKLLGLKDNVVIPTVLLIQFVGMFGAWSFARLSGRIGNFPALAVSMVIWILICIGAYFITDAAGFVTAAFFIGLVMGGSQSLARSTYSKMLPETTTDHTSFFSFFDVTEKVATAAGTFSFGIIEAITGSMRYSVLAICIFFVLGLTFLLILTAKSMTPKFAVE